MMRNLLLRVTNMLNKFLSAKRTSDASSRKTSSSSVVDTRPADGQDSLRAIREFRRTKVASKRIPSRIG